MHLCCLVDEYALSSLSGFACFILRSSSRQRSEMAQSQFRHSFPRTLSTDGAANLRQTYHGIQLMFAFVATANFRSAYTAGGTLVEFLSPRLSPTRHNAGLRESCSDNANAYRGPRIIAVAGNLGDLWGEQHGIETRTKPNHSWVNSGRLTIGGNYSRSPDLSKLREAMVENQIAARSRGSRVRRSDQVGERGQIQRRSWQTRTVQTRG